MDISLEGKIALVTGASSGIGVGIARVLVECGARVVITGREQATIDKVAAEIGPSVTAIAADVSSQGDMDDLYRKVGNLFGRLDIVVANAGVGANAPLGQITSEKFATVIDTNLKGVLLTVQTALPLLGDDASVILVGSTASVNPAPSGSIYGAAKAGLRAFMGSWILDTKGRGLRINIVSPGAIDTASLRHALDAEEDESKIATLAARSPLGRIGTPEEVGNVVAFLSSSAASFVNGAEIFVDGGLKV